MTDIHVESWTLNKNGDKQTTATKNLSEISICTVETFVQKGIGYQKKKKVYWWQRRHT